VVKEVKVRTVTLTVVVDSGSWRRWRSFWISPPNGVSRHFREVHRS